MIDDLRLQAQLFIGLAGAIVAAFLGSMSRNIYVEGGFKWLRVAFDLPFAVTCAIVAAGIGSFFHVAPIVINALAGAAGFLGPEWLHGFLKSHAARAGKGAEGGDKEPD